VILERDDRQKRGRVSLTKGEKGPSLQEPVGRPRVDYRGKKKKAVPRDPPAKRKKKRGHVGLSEESLPRVIKRKSSPLSGKPCWGAHKLRFGGKEKKHSGGRTARKGRGTCKEKEEPRASSLVLTKKGKKKPSQGRPFRMRQKREGGRW